MFRKSLVLLNKIKNISAKEIKSLFDHFPDIDDTLRANKHKLIDSGLKDTTADRFLSLRDSGWIDKELRLMDKERVSLIDYLSPDYPLLLKEITYPPLVIYVKGDKSSLSDLCFGIVGSRLASFYGIAMAEKFSFSLSALGIVIVSGLAKGIDYAAHKKALDAGKTIAVLGSGIANIYPHENKYLAEKISHKGAVISEFPLETSPLKENFPRRNRIISGLSKGVLVVEAAARSGALITARYALEQNREVFALPGKINSPLSKGTHLLIKEGAKLVDSLEDILDELNVEWRPREHSINLDSKEKIIFDIIDREGIFMEEMIIKSGLTMQEVSGAILALQIKGLVEEKKPFYFTRRIYG
ncbi:MAG: DNA protecting protein DprA [Candidatus Omnitrophica bacterium 4484_171]|nr:MAG: DNA protecting protein DprA [Candidatus Omnitrophica bacterium 4484_171]